MISIKEPVTDCHEFEPMKERVPVSTSLGTREEQKPELVQQPPITYTYNSNASRDERLKAALLALLNSDLIKVAGNKFTKQDLIDWVEKQKPAEWSKDDQHQKEQVLNALRLELNKWLNHSVRGMKSGNPAYFQGKITLIHDLLGFVHDIDESDRVFCSQVVLEPNEEGTFQVSAMVSYELLVYFSEHEDGFKMLADQIVSELKRQTAKLL